MSIKSFLIGSPIETIREKHERLTKTMGLAVFSSNANQRSISFKKIILGSLH